MESCTVYRANENQQQDVRKVEPIGYKPIVHYRNKTHTHRNYNTTTIHLYSLLAGEPAIKISKKKNNLSFFYFNP